MREALKNKKNFKKMQREEGGWQRKSRSELKRLGKVTGKSKLKPTCMRIREGRACGRESSMAANKP